MSFEDEIRQQKAGINMGEQRREMWGRSKLRPSDPVRAKPTGKIKTVIEEALPSINTIFDYDETRNKSYSSKKFSTKAPDNLYHVRHRYDDEKDYYYGFQKSFDVEIGTIKVNMSKLDSDETWDVQIWIFSDGDVAYAVRRKDNHDDYDSRFWRLLRPEDYADIYHADLIIQEDKISKLKNVEITPENVGITAEVIRQKILDKVVKMQMKKEKELPSKGCYIATAVYGSYDCPEVWVLRRYRDFILLQNPFGQLFVKSYYAISPTLVKLFGNAGWFRKFWKERLDRMVTRLRNKGVSDKPYRDWN